MGSAAQTTIVALGAALALGACRAPPPRVSRPPAVEAGPPAIVPPPVVGGRRAMIARVLKPMQVENGEHSWANTVLPRFEVQGVDPIASLVVFDIAPPIAFEEHIHHGFESITYLLEGAFRQADRLGNDRTMLAGGVQWFVAAPGFGHSEWPGTAQHNVGVQVWSKVPGRLLSNSEFAQVDRLPTWRMAGYEARAVVGDGSPVRTVSGLLMIDAKIAAGGAFTHPVPPDWNAVVYVVSGNAVIEEVRVRAKECALLTAGDVHATAFEGPARVLLIAGRPWGEPVKLAGDVVE
jgi:hypothetical protein